MSISVYWYSSSLSGREILYIHISYIFLYQNLKKNHLLVKREQKKALKKQQQLLEIHKELGVQKKDQQELKQRYLEQEREELRRQKQHLEQQKRQFESSGCSHYQQ